MECLESQYDSRMEKNASLTNEARASASGPLETSRDSGMIATRVWGPAGGSTATLVQQDCRGGCMPTDLSE